MDICVLNPFFYPYAGGTEKVLLQVYGRLAKRHNVTVLSAMLDNSNKRAVDYIQGIRVVRLPTKYVNMPGLPLPLPIMHGLNGEIEKAGADLYHINNRFVYFPSTIRKIKSLNKTLALTIHNALPHGINLHTDAGGLLYDVLIGRKTMHAADIITAVSKNTIETTVPERDRNKAHVVYNGIDYRRFKHRGKREREVEEIEKRLELNGASILNNARLVPQKGQQYLIKAVADLEKSRDISLVLLGRGPLERKLRGMIARLGMEKKIRIISGVPEEELPYYYNAFDLFALPSLYEPGSVALLEAMASELPIIATKAGGTHEVLREGGIYIREKDAVDTKEKIAHALRNRTEMAERARRARSIVVEEHDWDKIAKRYETLFEETLKK